MYDVSKKVRKLEDFIFTAMLLEKNEKFEKDLKL